MQDPRALKNPRNLSSWRAWEGKAYERSGFAVIVGCFFAPLSCAFVLFPSLFGRALGNHLIPAYLIGLILYLAASIGLMALAFSRVKAWKRAHPWTPPA